MEKYYLYIRIFLLGKKIELPDKIVSHLIYKLIQQGNNYNVELDELKWELDELKRKLENLKNE